jgi:Rrf2 family protein
MKYLETIAGVLHRAGFVLSLRGKNGGYKLAKKPGDYTVGSIIKLTEGGLAPVACLDSETNECSRAEYCVTLPMWEKLGKLIDDYLESITLEDLVKRQNGLIGNDYRI